MGTMRYLACLLVAMLGCAATFGSAARATDLRDTTAVAVLGQDAALQALYAARNAAPLWTGDPAADARRSTMLALLALEHRTELATPDATALGDRFADPSPAAETAAELALSRAALAYLTRRDGGAEVPTVLALTVLQRLGPPVPTRPLAVALTELEVVRDLGGWRAVGTVPGPLPTTAPVAVVSPELDVAPSLPPRKELPEPVSLRQRLVQSADLPAPYLQGEAMDQWLVDAVRRFQKRHGLAPDGVVGRATLAALNAPVADQIAQVRINLARPVQDRSLLPRYVEVNIPGYELRLVDHGQVILRSRVVVGEKDKPTPIFDDRIRYIEFNPSWYVPDSITPELVDKEQQKPGYLAKNGFYWRTAAETGVVDRLVQRPGPDNALGRVKFLFPNHDAIYLHDTPQRGAFGRNNRSLSHGCVRVEKHFELALALLRDQGWDAGRLDATFAAQKTRRVALSQPVPVFLDYRTAYLDDDGRLNLRDDLYGHDSDGTMTFAGKGLRPEPPPMPAPLLVGDPPAPIRPPVPIPSTRRQLQPQSTAIEISAAPS